MLRHPQKGGQYDQESRQVIPDNGFQPDIPTRANFLQARTALINGEEKIILDFEMLDLDSPTSVGFECSLDNARKLVHTTLASLKFFGDQPAAILLGVLRQAKQRNGQE